MTPKLVRLLSLMSPGFPTGAFGYSFGLEAAFQSGTLNNASELFDWICCLIRYGSLRNDTILVAESWRAYPDSTHLTIIEDNARAIAPSASRFKEQCALGGSFLHAVRDGYRLDSDSLPDQVSLPVAAGAVSSHFEIPLDNTVAGFAHMSIVGLVQAALRLAPIGQRKGVALVAKLEPFIEELAVETLSASLDNLLTATLTADTLSMTHETLSSRIFLS